MKNIDKYRGCLVGGASGDALGYAVEFYQEDFIFKKYGENGITEYDLINGIAHISDDTQMTLFTANGLLLGTKMCIRDRITIISNFSEFAKGAACGLLICVIIVTSRYGKRLRDFKKRLLKRQ